MQSFHRKSLDFFFFLFSRMGLISRIINFCLVWDEASLYLCWLLSEKTIRAFFKVSFVAYGKIILWFSFDDWYLAKYWPQIWLKVFRNFMQLNEPHYLNPHEKANYFSRSYFCQGAKSILMTKLKFFGSSMSRIWVIRSNSQSNFLSGITLSINEFLSSCLPPY